MSTDDSQKEPDLPQEQSAPKKEENLNDTKTQELRESERIRELRDRLYARGSGIEKTTRHALPQHAIYDTVETPVQGSEKHNHIPTNKEYATPPVSVRSTADTSTEIKDSIDYTTTMGATPKRRSYRLRVILGGMAFFVLALVVSALFMSSGNNTISGENISISVAGPISIGGGEEIPFQVSIANQNAVPIQSATLIIEYPKGTQSVAEINKELLIERRPLDTIGKGELINIPLSARMFGEENEEKEIKVSIDYRISGSNAVFQKKATPLRFKISTSPIVMSFDALKTISSGQETELVLTIQSNAPTPLTDILVKASYPEGFNFTESDPETVSGEDTWKFSTIKPNEKKVIKIKGLITGYESEARRFSATAGVANETDKNSLASLLANAQTDIEIEKPFLDVGIVVNGSGEETVVIDTDETAVIDIKYRNALDAAIYDGKVLVELDGNALDEFEVKAQSGFYDSSKNTITWDAVDEESLKEILPGRTSNLSFSIHPKENVGKAPQLHMTVTIKGQRIYEDKVPQELIGTASRIIKVESIPTISSSALYETGPFTNTGPTPPVAENVTQYTYTLMVKSGANDVAGAEVTAVIPQYVSWLDLVTPGDVVTYNATTRTMKWAIGDMDANTTEEVSMQVSFLPSLSQVGTSPTILESQKFKATDRFTGTVIRTEHPALTTSLFDESDEDLKDGRVRAE